jgi:uncharacterized protein
MPEYLAPGVYLEEVSFRSNVIVGAGTTTTAFVGPTRYGPIYEQPDILTSLSDYEQVYGDGQQLVLGGDTFDNYMWQAARAFFIEGGATLYVKRIFSGTPDAATAKGTVGAGIPVSARYPGAYGELQVSFTLAVGPNVVAKQKDPVTGSQVPVARGLNEFDVVLVGRDLGTSPPGSPPAGAIFPIGSPPSLGSPPSQHSFVAPRYDASGNVVTYVEYTFAWADLALDPSSGDQVWQLRSGGGAPAIAVSSLNPASAPAGPGDTVQIVTLTLSATPPTSGALPEVWSGLPLDERHNLDGALDSVGAVFNPVLAPGAAAPPLVVDVSGHTTGLGLLYALGAAIDLVGLSDAATPSSALTASIVLQGGTDGALPDDADYEGAIRPDDTKTGLVSFEDLTDISIVAAPGSTATYTSNTDQVHAIINSLIAHAEKMKYRIAVVDAGKGQTISQVRAMRGQFDSSWAAFYYPWVTILDPITNQPNNMPPSGFVAGIYARNDFNRAVYKAPANEVVNLAIRFERPINKAQQEILNPAGINCFRFFEGRGYRLWGARLMSSDPLWLYVNLRRYFAFVEQSIDQSTQWAVFEPNGPVLWGNIQSTVNDFLFEQWQEGALLGDKATDAYFVRCDRSTMTQNDIDNGRMVCLIGIAVVRPAEFVIFRIGQWTASH